MQKQRFRLRNNFILNILFSFSSFVLALFGFLAVLPPASEPEVSAIIDGEQFALTITNSEAINLEINPTESGTIAVAKDTIVANTNSPAGYKLYVSTDSETSNDIHLNGRESNDTEDKKIVAASGTFNAPAALEQNESSWGFALAGINGFDSSYDIANPSPSAKFAAVPEKNNEQLIHDHAGRATDDETEIYFAAKANTNIASGNYQTTILYTTLSEATDQDTTEINLENVAFPTNYETATVTMNISILSSKTPTIIVKVGTKDATNVVITNNAPLSLTFNLPANLAEGTYDVTLYITNLAKSYTKQNAIGIYKPMQEMTPEFCESMTLEEQKQFLDTRDNKIYFAAKLKDGNCWMTQNLDYDLSVQANQTLTPATSNVTENRTVVPANTDLATWNGDDNNAVYYLDGGDYYYANGTTKTEGYSTLPTNDVNRHYAGGDYYSWKAATAGQGTTSITNTDINESICPAGWRLPTSNSYTANYSFGKLTDAYGITNSADGNSDAALLASPLFFVRGGFVHSGSLYDQGGYGLYWSSRAHSSSGYAYRLYFNSSYVYTNNNYLRFRGFSVRCVAQSKNTFTLTYDANTGSGAPETQTETTTNPTHTFTIPSTTPQKEGFVFLGWSESQNATTATYQPGAEITLDIHTQNKTLYAIYEEAKTISRITTMQQITPEICAASAEHETVQLKDIRDNKTYWVTKLKDGNCWMTQNLDYDLSVASNQTLTPATSNVTENRTVVPVAWGEGYNSIYYLDGGDVYYTNGTTKTEGLSSLPADDVNRHYAQGDCYSWKAATAGQGTTSIKSADVNESICPAGWRLPASNSADANYSFGNLAKQYGYAGGNQDNISDATLLASPLFFARGGNVVSGTLRIRGSYGYYWSSRAYSNSEDAYGLSLNSSSVYPSRNLNRGVGFSVRCVAL